MGNRFRQKRTRLDDFLKIQPTFLNLPNFSESEGKTSEIERGKGRRPLLAWPGVCVKRSLRRAPSAGNAEHRTKPPTRQ
jgi:hypothetical protein